MKRTLLCLAVVCTAMSISSRSYAITIVLNEAAVGSTLPSSNHVVVAADTSCMYPSNGNYRAVIRAAANYWQTIYTLPYTVTITWGFVNLGSGTNAATVGTHLQQGGSAAGTIDQGTLALNSKPGPCWYIDSNANTWGEFPSSGAVTSAQIPYNGRPGQMVEVGRFTNVSASGNTSHKDLFSTVLHELGHLLGMTPHTWRYTNEVTDGDIDVVSWHVCPGLSWLSSGGHLIFAGNPRLLMSPTGPNGRREWPSQGDISTISQISDWWTTSWGAGGGGVTGVAANNPVNE